MGFTITTIRRETRHIRTVEFSAVPLPGEAAYWRAVEFLVGWRKRTGILLDYCQFEDSGNATMGMEDDLALPEAEWQEKRAAFLADMRAQYGESGAV